MFVFNPRKETAVRIVLIAVILLNALVTSPVIAQADQESTKAIGMNTKGMWEGRRSISVHSTFGQTNSILNNTASTLSKTTVQNEIVGGIDWVLNGNAATIADPDAIKLTNDSNDQVGSAWASQQIDLTQDFNKTFNLYLGHREAEYWSGDGITFVFQNVGTNAIGGGGGGIGYETISPSVAVEFDTWQNIYNPDPLENHVAVLKNGSILHNSSLPVVLSSGSFENGEERTFQFVWTASTKNLRVIEYLDQGGALEYINYTEDFAQTVFSGNPIVWFGFTASTASGKNLHYFYPSSVVTDLSTYSSDCGLDSNISCTAECTQGSEGGPINTRTGGYDYSATDLTIQTSVGPLTFDRSYSSLATNLYSGNLGYGWTHSQDVHLSIGAYDANNQREITLKGHTANQYGFTQTSGSLTTIPDPGIYATLTQGSSAFILTDKSQNKYEFNLTTGRLLAYSDSSNHTWNYIYDVNGRLERVSADGGLRHLEIDYDTQGRVLSVNDHAGRSVSYHYNTNGDLDSFVDVLGQTWIYEYHQTLSHILTRVAAPGNVTIERTEYYADGRAWKQFDGEGNLVVELIYNADGSTTIKDALNRIETDTYDGRGTLVSDENAAGAEQKHYDFNFRPTAITNDAGQTLEMTWSADGVNLLSKTDPAGNPTDYTYDSLNNLTSVTDPLNNTTTYTYNGKLLTSSEDALGGETTYTYTSAGYLESVTDTAGRETTYTYDSFGQRTSMTDPSGNTWNYTYDALGRSINTTDPRGRVTHNEYNVAGKLTRVTQNYNPAHPQNYQNLYNIVTEYEYDTRGNQIAVTDTYGRTTQYVYDDANRLLQTIDAAGNTTTNGYDAAGQLISTTDPLNHTTTYEYDAAGRLIKTINPLGYHSGITIFNVSNNTSTVTDILGRATVFHYDELGRVIKVVDPLGNFATTTYDENGNVAMRKDQLSRETHYAYDELNRLISSIDPNGGITQTIYNAAGNRVATIDPLNHQTTYTYDSVGRLIATTDPLTRVTQTEYDTYGRRAATIDAAGHQTTYTYDLLDRVITVTDPAGNTTHTTYNALGNVLARTDANGNTTTSTYDVLNRPLVTTDAEGNETTNAYDAGGNLISVTDALGFATTYTYDALNRRIAVSDPLGNTTASSYDALGNLSTAIDANGVVTLYLYDPLNRQVAVILNYKSGVAADAETNVRYEFAYNAVGNRISVKDPNGSVTTYGYDALNRVIQKQDPLTNTWAYTYDLAGNRLSATDAKNQTIQYTYDAAGQLTGINYPGTDPDVAFTYNLNGQRLSMTDGLGTTTWTYDNLDRPITTTDAFNKTLGYDYDAVGNRTELTYPDGKTVTYAYDDVNRLTGVTDWDTQQTGYEYDAVGRLTSVALPNGVSSQYTYDQAGRLTALQHDSGVNALASYNYTYDPAGRLTQAIEDVLSLSVPAGDFPGTGILDDFNRADGAIGSNWSGNTFDYNVSANKLHVDGNGSNTDIYWSSTAFGADQEAYVTFTQANTNATEQDLLLKSQSNSTWGDGVLEVLYDAVNQRVQVWTYEWPQEWVQHGDDIPVTFEDGDTFGARALADGTVEVYKNGEMLASRDITGWSHYAEGGYIGLWFIGAEDAVLDNFGGGTAQASEGEGLAGMSPEESNSLAPSLELEIGLDPFNMELSNASAFWQGIPLGSEQEANVTFTQLNKAAGGQKPQSNGVWGEGVLEVLYDVPNQRIQVWAYAPEIGWVQQGADIPVQFVDGDQFSARAQKDGAVEIYQNGQLLTRSESSSLSHQAAGTISAPESFAHAAAFQPVVYHPTGDDAPILPNPVLSGVEGLPLPNLPLQQTSSLTIDYTYDPLNRLTSATYSDGRNFGYVYDASGNVLELAQNLGPGTVITTYTYNTANELVTAQQGSTTWQYDYDANGSLISDGVKTYTYDSANRLVEVSEQSSVTSLTYNGLGQRLSMDAAGVIAHYVLDGNQPLTADSGGNVTTFLYGLGPIGEKTNVWNFALPDGSNTPRQLTDTQGDITLSIRYTPWGGTLETNGTGNFTFGYIGGILDATTGLLYVGNGQYYDPATGRFLTRGVNPDSTNPYVPWNPIGAVIGPLALFSMVARRKKGKGNPYLLMLLMLVVLPLSVGMACSNPFAPVPTQAPTVIASASIPAPLPTQTPSQTVPPPPADPPTDPDCCVTETPSPTLPSTPTTVSDFAVTLLSIYGVELKNSSDQILGMWNQNMAFNAWRAVTDVANRLGGSSKFRQAFNTINHNLVLLKVESYIEYLSGNVQVVWNTGAITKDTHLVEIANIEYDVLDSIRNNIVHELGHVFNNNHGNPAETIMPYTFVERRKEFLRPVRDDGVMWQLHPPLDGQLSTETETFADMFVAHVYYAWLNPSRIAPDPQKWMEGIVK